MGSRSFYEGWDSNRPNVILFINIGMGEDARKFILQSVGRGVRIEPVKGKRKRAVELYNAKEINEELFNEIKDKITPIETLFIFGTNRSALKEVLGKLEEEKRREGEYQLSLSVNDEAKKNNVLLVPTYKEAGYPLLNKREIPKFEISNEDFNLVKKFVELTDDRVLLMKYSEKLKDMPVEKLRFLRESINRESEFYKPAGRSFKDIDIAIQRIFDHISIIPMEFEKLKELDEEIRHFKNIRVYLKDVNEIQRKIEKVKDYPAKKEQLKSELSKLSEEARKQIEALLVKESEETYEYNHKKLRIKYVANHYYLPLILSEEEKIDYIKHIIKTKSEVNFINDLEDYLSNPDNKFKEFDWWMFSKIDESLDEVYIPYYNPKINKISKFYPDFIFWLKKENNYFIVFIDPKGTEHADAYRKIDGYKELFEENGKEKVFNYNGYNVRIKLFLRPEDVSKALPEYKQYWFDDIEKMLNKLGI